MRGKKGPYPNMKVTSESGVEVIEESFLPEDPTAEEIVGKENVVDVDSPQEEQEDSPQVQQGYHCSDCTFRSHLLSEIEEHCSGAGHGGFKTRDESAPDPVQPELFSTPGVVHRLIEVPMDDALLNEKRVKLASLYQSALEVKDEKKAADEDCNARLKHIDSQMQEIARVLKAPFVYEKTDCEWRIIEDENARGLYRLDTGELIEKQPLTAEDMAAELEKAQAENAATESALLATEPIFEVTA